MTTAFIAQAILLEVSLSFLGLGVTEPTPAHEFLMKEAYSFDLDNAVPRTSSQPVGWQIAWPHEHERSQRHDDPGATAAGSSPNGLPPLREVITLGPDPRAGACVPGIETYDRDAIVHGLIELSGPPSLGWSALVGSTGGATDTVVPTTVAMVGA